MQVKLLTMPNHLALMEHNAAHAMLTCHANTDRLGDELNQNFIKRAIEMQHDSILEHIILSYEVHNLSRACLQELARHRLLSLSVESTRYTLKQQLKADETVISLPDEMGMELKEIISDYLKTLVNYVKNYPDIQNDVLKYAIPECICTNLVITANVREFRHVIGLRTTPSVLQEFRNLAHEFVNCLPESYKYLLKDCIYADKRKY